MASPIEPRGLPSAHQVCMLVELLMNLTLPSQRPTFAPPECQLEALEIGEESPPQGPGPQ